MMVAMLDIFVDKEEAKKVLKKCKRKHRRKV